MVGLDARRKFALHSSIVSVFHDVMAPAHICERLHVFIMIAYAVLGVMMGGLSQVQCLTLRLRLSAH